MPALTPENLSIFLNRIDRLRADSKPRWGRLDAKTMMRHLRRALEISRGEVEITDRSVPGLRWIVRLLFFHVFTTWPPSRARLPEYWFPPTAKPFQVEKDLFLKELGDFIDALEQSPGRRTVHTLLGPLTLRSWSRVHGVHFNHHFRQFRLLCRWERLEYWQWLVLPIFGVVAWLVLR